MYESFIQERKIRGKSSTSDNVIRWLRRTLRELIIMYAKGLPSTRAKKSVFECRPWARQLCRVSMTCVCLYAYVEGWNFTLDRHEKKCEKIFHQWEKKVEVFPIFHLKLRCKINRWAKLSSRDYWKRRGGWEKIEDMMMAVAPTEQKKEEEKQQRQTEAGTIRGAERKRRERENKTLNARHHQFNLLKSSSFRRSLLLLPNFFELVDRENESKNLLHTRKNHRSNVEPCRVNEKRKILPSRARSTTRKIASESECDKNL